MSPEMSDHAGWLAANGPRELELLLRSLMFQPAAAALLTSGTRSCQGISAGAARLLSVPKKELLGRPLDDFLAPQAKAEFASRWPALLETGELRGELRIEGNDGQSRPVEYLARAHVLPEQHLLVVRERRQNSRGDDEGQQAVEDYALSTLDPEGRVEAWYSGAERTYGYAAPDVIGKQFPGVTGSTVLRRAMEDGHSVTEGWQARRDGTKFWANTVTAALRDEAGVLRGFARIVRDFSGRHEFDERLRQSRPGVARIVEGSTVSAVVSGEYEQLQEANDAFLGMLGYSHEDLREGLLTWPALTPGEYSSLDDLAHEEELMYGACTPYEKVLLAKDGRRVPVLVAVAVLKLYPFRWIAFVQGLPDRAGLEIGDEQVPESTSKFEEIIGTSSAMKRVMAQVELVAPTDATVLILGETGTGKELIARAVHKLSRRARLPFVTLNCAAIPTGLLESELFGYEKGAFTGALAQKIGRFEMANRGTLFLDEVGDIPLDIQPKLLRALQEKSLERLGGTRTIPIDVRLVAATNRNLTQMMGDKLFRSDLYYRLKVFPVLTPALRDRPEDIPLLVRHFTKKYSASMERHIDTIPAETMRALVNWPWPGNVRELENFIERAVILSSGSILRVPLAELRTDAIPAAGGTLEQVERDHIVRVLKECGGVITTAAARLGVPRTTLNAMMRKLGVTRKDL